MSGQYVVLKVLQSLRGRDVTGFWASVGYSAIYFVLHGARKVIALGPLPAQPTVLRRTSTLAASLRGQRLLTQFREAWPPRVPCNYGIDTSVDFLPLSQQCADGTCEVRS
jgi:hypothetical protein